MKRLLPALALILVAVALYALLLGRREPAPPSLPEAAATVDGAVPRAAATPSTVERPATASDGAATAAKWRQGEVVIRGPWGSGPGQFGRKRESEANPEAPMAMVAGPKGEVAIVDQVNRRVQRFRDGKPAGIMPMGGDTIQDLAFGPDGRTILLDRLADKSVQIYDRDGKLINEATLVGPGVPEGGAVTAVFADDQGTYVEREHTTLVRVADAKGNSDPERKEYPGRPSRDGKLFIAAAIVDRVAGQLVVRAWDRATGQPAWTAPVQLPAPILHIQLLDSDRQGMIYLAALVGHESEVPPYSLIDDRLACVRLGAGGAPRGLLELPPLPSTGDETFRPLSVGDDGTIYAMRGGEPGLEVVAYRFP